MSVCVRACVHTFPKGTSLSCPSALSVATQEIAESRRKIQVSADFKCLWPLLLVSVSLDKPHA